MRAFICLGFVSFCAASLLAQSDAVRFAEGQAALDKHNDCAAAIEAFDSVSSQGKTEPLWAFYMAKAQECKGDLNAALTHYLKYDELNPGQAEVVAKVGDLRYRLKKQQQAEEAVQKRQDAKKKLLADITAARSAIDSAWSSIPPSWRDNMAQLYDQVYEHAWPDGVGCRVAITYQVTHTLTKYRYQSVTRAEHTFDLTHDPARPVRGDNFCFVTTSDIPYNVNVNGRASEPRWYNHICISSFPGSNPLFSALTSLTSACKQLNQ